MKDAETTKNVWSCPCVALDEKYLSSFVYEESEKAVFRAQSKHISANNPAKVEMLSANGIEVVERVALKVGRTDENTRYLDVKAAKSGHLM